jgi:hypothetical protein
MSQESPDADDSRPSTARTIVIGLVALALVMGLATVIGGGDGGAMAGMEGTDSGDGGDGEGGEMTGMDSGGNGTTTGHDMENMTHDTETRSDGSS